MSRTPVSPGINALCAQCSRECKQDIRADVLACPQFQSCRARGVYPSARDKPLRGRLRGGKTPDEG